MIIARATIIFAPEEIPSTYGPAIGLEKNVCNKNPERASAPPRHQDTRKTDFPDNIHLHLCSFFQKQDP